MTIYWGDKPWDAPVTLRDMLADMDARLATLVDDCNINLFSIIDLVKIPEFKTELKQVVSVLNARNSGNEMNDLIATDEVYKHLDRDTARILSAFTSLKMPRKNKEGEYNMCKAVMEIQKKSETEARIRDIRNLMENVKWSAEQAMKALGIPESDYKKYMSLL